MLCCAIGATATVTLNGKTITKGNTDPISTYGITSGSITYNSSGQLIHRRYSQLIHKSYYLQ